ncbi:MAG: UTP--glucose-1-phosphate uridylyltransferase [Hahellaceae bacterium]|nr:UTP--glucose-1-phosphate uridylyltransferase [Hahellaceae bacterium]
MKAVIPVAGFGTRMLPASKAIPKELITLLDKPLIQYVVNEAALAGITDVVFVTHASKAAIENHFDTHFELESQLINKGNTELLKCVRSIAPSGMCFSAVRQARGQGLGHAVLCARSLIGDDDFVVMLPDVLLSDYECNHAKDNLAAMCARFAESQVSQILVEDVPPTEVNKYGIADLANIPDKGAVAQLNGVVEKPPVGSAPSTLAVVGRYVLSRQIWPLLAQTEPGRGGEVQLTDAIDALIRIAPVEAFRMTGRSHDCGSKAGYIETFVEYALRHPRYCELVKSKFAENM